MSSLLSRFAGNEMLLVRFVKKFPSDTSFSNLAEAVKNSDYDSAEMYAHTIKGVAANLGLNYLSEKSADIVAAVRAKDYEAVSPAFEEMSQLYADIVSDIGNLD